jgi:hypothetical protein
MTWLTRVHKYVCSFGYVPAQEMFGYVPQSAEEFGLELARVGDCIHPGRLAGLRAPMYCPTAYYFAELFGDSN